MEDVKHFLIKCDAWDRERKELMEKIKSFVAGFDEEEEERTSIDFRHWHV